MSNLLDKEFEQVNKAINCTVDGVPNDMHSAYNTIQVPLTSSAQNGVAGKADFNWDKFAIEISPGADIGNAEDCVFARFVKPPSAKIGGTAKLYVSWEQADGATENTAFYFQYKITEPGGAPSDWVTGNHIPSDPSNEVFPRPESGETVNQLTDLGELGIPSLGIYSELVIRLTMVSNYGEPIIITSLLLVMDFDQLGSRTPISK